MLHLAAGELPLVGALRRRPAGRRPAVERFRHRADDRDAGGAVVGRRLARRTGSPATSAPDESLIPTFTSAPLDEALDVVGFAAAELAWESSAPVATAVVRLMDVAPDGTPAR